MPETNHLAPFQMLPAKPGVCPECAVHHSEGDPHNQKSLCYQYHYYSIHGRWPTWTDAMAHCDDETKAKWSRTLLKIGQKLE